MIRDRTVFERNDDERIEGKKDEMKKIKGGVVADRVADINYNTNFELKTNNSYILYDFG